MASRRERGLCYNYDERYDPNHNCRAMFFLLVASEDDEPLNSDPLASLKETQPSPTPIDHPPAQLSLHALSGHPVSATLRVKGNIWGHEVVILVDGGSTHNFVHDLLAHFLHLATQLIP